MVQRYNLNEYWFSLKPPERSIPTQTEPVTLNGLRSEERSCA